MTKRIEPGAGDTDKRSSRGGKRDGAFFPASPATVQLPVGYTAARPDRQIVQQVAA